MTAPRSQISVDGPHGAPMMTSGSSEKDRLYDLGQVLASPAGRAPVAKDYVECCQIGRFSDVVVLQRL